MVTPYFYSPSCLEGVFPETQLPLIFGLLGNYRLRLFYWGNFLAGDLGDLIYQFGRTANRHISQHD